MDKKPQATVDPVFEELDLYTEWVHEAGLDTLVAYLPGFRKEQLKVQVTSAGKLRLSGERPVGENKWSRFRKEFLLPPNCDVNQVNANFKGGMLYVKLPKLITTEPSPASTPADTHQEKPKPASTTVASPTPPQRPATTNQTPKKDLQTQTREPTPVPPMITPEKAEGPQKTPANEPTKQQTGKEKPPEKVTEKAPEKAPEKGENAKSDQKTIGVDKDPKKEEKGDLVEENKSKNRAEMKADSAQKEACSIGTASQRMMGSGMLDRVGVYKEAFGDFVTDLRSRKKFMGAAAVVLVAIVVGFIAKKALESSDASQ